MAVINLPSPKAIFILFFDIVTENSLQVEDLANLLMLSSFVCPNHFFSNPGSCVSHCMLMF